MLLFVYSEADESYLVFGPFPASFSFTFCLFKHQSIFTQEINVKNDPSSMWH